MPSHSPAGLVRKTVNSSVKTRDERGERPHPRLPADGADRAHDRRLAEPVAARLDGERDEEERAGHEHGDERRLLGREAEREQRADQRRLVAPRPVEEAERDGEQRERDARDVDVLAREAAVVEVRRAERERDRRRERADAPDLRRAAAPAAAPSACPSARARAAR